MSRILQNAEARDRYRCKRCAEEAVRFGGAPDLASAPAFCALYLYPMVLPPVQGQGPSEPTPLRVVAPHHVLVHAPPDTWAWGVDPIDEPPTTESTPTWSQSTPTWYFYDAEESNATWAASSAYKDVEPNRS